MNKTKIDYSKLSKAELMALLAERDAAEALNHLLETTKVTGVLEEKMKKTASLIINKDENSVMLHLDICDLWKLDEMIENIYELSGTRLHDHHWRLHHLVIKEMKRDPSSIEDYSGLLEDLNKTILTVAQSGDFCGELHRIIKTETDKM